MNIDIPLIYKGEVTIKGPREVKMQQQETKVGGSPMARGPHCGQYSIERGGSQEGIKKWEDYLDSSLDSLLDLPLDSKSSFLPISSISFSY